MHFSLGKFFLKLLAGSSTYVLVCVSALCRGHDGCQSPVIRGDTLISSVTTSSSFAAVGSYDLSHGGRALLLFFFSPPNFFVLFFFSYFRPAIFLFSFTYDPYKHTHTHLINATRYYSDGLHNNYTNYVASFPWALKYYSMALVYGL